MLEINSLFSKLLYLLLFVISLKCENVSGSNSNFFDFEQIKSDLFNPATFNNSNGESCSTELIAISRGIINSEEWAFKCKWNENHSNDQNSLKYWHYSVGCMGQNASGNI